MHTLSSGNELSIMPTELRFCTKPQFEEEAELNLKMVYSLLGKRIVTWELVLNIYQLEIILFPPHEGVPQKLQTN